MQTNTKQHVTLEWKAKGHLVSNSRVKLYYCACVILLVVLRVCNTASLGTNVHYSCMLVYILCSLSKE